MSEVLITSVPIHGHVAPLLAVAKGLVERGHRVRVVTGSRFADAVASTGAVHLPLTGIADYDDRTLAAARDGTADRQAGGMRSLRADVHQVFLAPAEDQYRALVAALEQPTDVVLTEPTFVASSLLAALPRAGRPAVVGLGVVPLVVVSADAAPYGLGLPPLRNPVANRLRNRALHAFSRHVVFRPVQQELDRLARRLIGRPAATFVLDAMSGLDAVVQLTVPSFEYPRGDLRVPVHFAGPVTRGGGTPPPPPRWWSDVEGGRPVVVVTQGTIANTDLGELVLPTVRALAEDDVLVVVTTGGPPVESLGPLPPNVRAAAFLDYESLFAHTDVFVTNGGYGGVQYALAHGVPVVVAGETEDKPEVAARVQWAGVGVNLRTGRPGPDQVRTAVRAVLAEPRYRAAAGRVAAEIARAPGLDLVEELVSAQARG